MTNDDRRELKRMRRMEHYRSIVVCSDGRREIRNLASTPLRMLGKWMRGHGRSLRGCPRRTLEVAFIHLEFRIRLVMDRADNARTRANLLWLGRWIHIVNEEIGRREAIDLAHRAVNSG